VSQLLRPVGPHSPAVYWRRRVVLLLVVLVVVLVLRSLFGSSSSSSASDAPRQPAPTTGTAATTAAAAPPAVTPSPTATPIGDCADGDISLRTTTDAQTYPATVRPRFTLTVTNTSHTACRRNLGSGALSLTVTSGGARVWSSDDCNPGGPAGAQVLQPGAHVNTTLSWARVLSAPGCPTGRPPAGPGQYVVTGSADKASSPGAVFALR
jgi:hypothetical protein